MVFSFANSTASSFFPVRQFKALLDLFIKLAISYLFKNVGVSRFIYLEGLITMGAKYIVHNFLFLLVRYSKF